MLSSACALKFWGDERDDLPEVRRLEGNPIIRPDMLRRRRGSNINGPSMIRVPDFVENALGRYYLYFAHHRGRFIRLAYADSPVGPFRIHRPGALHIRDTPCDDVPRPGFIEQKHVASPDVHVIPEENVIRMYYHCPVFLGGDPDDRSNYDQATLIAESSDGVHFENRSGPIGAPYWRAFKRDGSYYALAMPGILYRSPNGVDDWEAGDTVLVRRARHSALHQRGDTLYVFYSRVGDEPERILVSKIDLTPPWTEWTTTRPENLVEPMTEWEGGLLPTRESERGAVYGPVKQLRDPGFFQDDGESFLLYSVQGERGIAIVNLRWP